MTIEVSSPSAGLLLSVDAAGCAHPAARSII
jgi:hypothetical protein